MSTSATHQPVHPTFADDPSDHARELVGTVAHEPVTPPSNGGGPRPPFRHAVTIMASC